MIWDMVLTHVILFSNIDIKLKPKTWRTYSEAPCDMKDDKDSLKCDYMTRQRLLCFPAYKYQDEDQDTLDLP